jgi:hypothetical protein
MLTRLHPRRTVTQLCLPFKIGCFRGYARQRVLVPASEMDVFKVEIMKDFAMRHDEVRDLCSIRNGIF